MPYETHADVIVVGLGAHGSATLHALAKTGARIIGIDRHSPPHAFGSSHGETRITRQAVGEGEIYAPLVLRSHELWREMEAETGFDLLLQCGGLVIAPEGGTARHHGQESFLNSTIRVAREFGIEHEILTSAELSQRFPQFRTRGDERAYFEPGAGLVYPERCIEAQLLLARRKGAVIHTGETVLSIAQSGGLATVKTDKAAYSAARVVVTAGAWIPGLVGGGFGQHLRVNRQTLYWYETANPALYAPDRFPIFIWMWGETAEEYFYGFPIVDGGTQGLKVATEQYATTTDPNTFDREVSQAERDQMFRSNIEGRFAGVGGDCLKAAACLYTTSPDTGFIIDRHPEHDRVLVVSACSGHGFKHSAGLGEAIAAEITGTQPAANLKPLTLERFAAEAVPA